MRDLISVIVPIYNAERWLERCINSIRIQDYTNIEIILINDGSTDSCKEICNNYVRLDSRIRYIEQKNRGVSWARNVGIEASKGKYVTFCDSDDWLEIDALSKLYRVAEIYGADYVIPRWVGHYYTKDGVFDKHVYDDDDVNLIINKTNIEKSFNYLFEHNSCFSTCGRLYKRAFLEFHNIKFVKELKILEDFCFNLNCIKVGKGVHSTDIVYNYSIYGIENYIYRRGYTVLKQSIPIVFNVFDDFITQMNFDKNSNYYDFVMSYWISAVKNIIESEKTVYYKYKDIQEVVMNVRKEKLLDRCTKAKIKTEYWLLFKTRSIFVFFMVQFLRHIKHMRRSNI